ncbi:LANO_0C06370g1_1 [Lachancea nothofagi CBS 11611]|uniref:LANO_0C06370g1_1 n=1 Tax=Lachancea nothofagi CBS 11611 TaxID=1266666 RepID=A0A1G4J880_9SACH|nr:LANO_0C06370g1_1 [Lachancea nothofagi CBS 11611]
MDKLGELKIDARKKSKSVDFRMPKIGESLDKFQKRLNLKLLAQGRLHFIKYLESVKGQLTQEQFDLIRSSALNQDNLMATSDKLHAKNIETKYLLIKRRFYVDADNVVRDHKNKDTVVCEPEMIFDLVLCGHLKNEHIHWRRLHRFLKLEYANITRDFTQLCVGYCSECNADGRMRPQQKYRHYNIYSGLFPLERVHVEIITPFTKPIEGTYAHLLYFRDYHSRFVWMQPLKSDSAKDLAQALSTFLLSLPRIPIFIETSTLNRQDLFEVCESISSQFALTIGLGMSRSVVFQKNGISRLRYQLRLHQKQCLDSWHMCLKYGATNQNSSYNTRILAIPGNLLYSTISDYARQFELKREELMEKLSASNVVELRSNGRRQGTLYLEDEASAFKMPDEEYISADFETESYEDEDLPPIDDRTPINSSPKVSNFTEPPSSISKKLLLMSDKPDANMSPEITRPLVFENNDSQRYATGNVSIEL